MEQSKKQLNCASLAKYGQETVQEIVERTKNIFQHNPTDIKQQMNTIKSLFDRLRLIYQKLNELLQENRLDYTEAESLVPYKDATSLKKYETDSYKRACHERDDLMKQVNGKNEQIKEVVHLMRKTIFEINNMLAMANRKGGGI